MKHAILILAHKNLVQIRRLIEYFTKDCDVYMHLDSKGVYDAELIQDMRRYPQVILIDTSYEVNWGGFSVLHSEMELLRYAYEHGQYDYFHLISGQDYPIRPLNYFLRFFECNNGREFIRYIHLPNPRWEHNTFRRLQYYYPYDSASDKPNPRKWVSNQVQQQIERGTKRPIPDEFDHLYGSSQWFSITSRAAGVLLEYTDKHPSLYRKMWMTFAPEECYVSTVLVNLIEKDSVECENKRFIRWKHENGNRPANLGCEHFHLLLEHDCLFARKIEVPCSSPLLDIIDRYLHKDADITSSNTGAWVYDGYLKYAYDPKFADYVIRLCFDESVRTAVDMGCGSGIYVAEWRRHNLPFAGYDANPYTKKLSQRLLPDGDRPCGIADLTEQMECREPFDLVICKDVLQYIPNGKTGTAIKNLARLSSHLILLSWNSPVESPMKPQTEISIELLCSSFDKCGFQIDEQRTSRLQIELGRSDCCVCIRQKSYYNNIFPN